MKYLLGDISSFAKGASTPRDRMHPEGDYRYLHYGDLYKGHDLYVDVDNPQKKLPFILDSEKIRANQFCKNEDIIYVLTSETVDDLGKALLLHNPLNHTVVAGTETTIMRIERREVALPRYINYLLQTGKFKKTLRQYVTGMKVFRVHPRDIARIEIDLPELSVQLQIVEVLDAISKKIRTNAKTNDYLEQLAKVLLSQYVYENASDEMIRVRDFTLSMSNGATPSRKNELYWEDGVIPWVKTGEVNNNYIFQTSECVTDLALEKTSIRLLPKDTVVMALYGSGTAGRLAMLQMPATTNQACTAMICDSPAKAFYLFLTLQRMYKQIDNLTRGSVQQNLSKDIVADLQIPEVSDETLSELGILNIYESISKRAEENIRLESLRDSLLPKLMSGEIDVSKVDITQLNNHLYDD